MSKKPLDKSKLHKEQHTDKTGKTSTKWVKNEGVDDKWIEKYKKYDLWKYPNGMAEKDVKVNLDGDIDSHWVLSWVDKKGKIQHAYTQEFMRRNSDKKWQTIAKFSDEVMGSVKKKAKNGILDEDDKLAQASAAILIIANTGLRVGDVKNYTRTGNRGVTTLHPDDITIDKDTVYFDFKGKSHKQNRAFVRDKVLAKYLVDRQNLAKKNASKFLFDVNRTQTDKVFKSDFKFSFKIKDMRTYVACKVAKEELYKDIEEIRAKLAATDDPKKRKKIIHDKLTETYKNVAEKLNNTPAMAKTSYVAPQVITDWIMRIGMDTAILQKAAEEFVVPTLDEIISKYPADDKEISIAAEDEESCDEYPLPEWCTTLHEEVRTQGGEGDSLRKGEGEPVESRYDELTEDFVKSHVMMTPEAYMLFRAGIISDIGHTDLEKAMTLDKSKYKKVRKLVHRNGKTYLATFWVAKHDSDDKHEDKDDRIHISGVGHKHDIGEGDDVIFEHEGGRLFGKVRSIKHGKTDPYGTAIIAGADGKSYSKSLKKVTPDKEDGKDKSPEKPESATKKTTTATRIVAFPTRHEDFERVHKMDTGSSEVYKVRYKDKYFISKIARDRTEGKAQLLEEQMCDSIYTAFGFDVPDSKTYESGKYKASAFVEGKMLKVITDKTRLEAVHKELRKGFVLDCVLANWDVIGANQDNIIVGDDNTVYRIDNGGALRYRARGAAKGSLFGEEVTELKNLLDESTNPVTARVYKGITNAEIKEQATAIVNDWSEVKKTIPDKELVKLLDRRVSWLKSNIVDKKEPPKFVEGDYDKTKYNSAATAEYFKDWDTFEFEGNPGIKEGIQRQILQVEKANEYEYQECARKRGITVEEYKKRLQAHIEKLMGEAEFFRSTDLKVLDQIMLHAKRWKSQFEVGKSHGSYSPDYRATTEYEYFNFNHEEHDSTKHRGGSHEFIYNNAEKRPIYGYTSSNANGVQNRSGYIPPPISSRGYGNVTVKLSKERMLKRTTVTFDDSLGRTSEMAATPANKPHFTSFAMSTYNDPLDMKSLATTDLGSYVEAQYHGGVGIADVEAIHFSTHPDQALRPVEMEKAVEIIRECDNDKIKAKFYYDR